MTAAKSTDRSPPPVILIVEDDEAVREALRETLVEEGFAAVTAEGGTEGLALMESARPDLVLLDLMMPGVSGWQVIERAERDPELNAIPIFILTAARDLA